MTSTASKQHFFEIDDKTIEEAKEATSPETKSTLSLVLRNHSGKDLQLPPRVEEILMSTLSAITRGESTTVSRTPDELTSTAAADLLGVSRPTLMKWANQKKISSFQVGTHTRFRREELDRFKDQRRQEQLAAFAELRKLDLDEEITD